MLRKLTLLLLLLMAVGAPALAQEGPTPGATDKVSVETLRELLGPDHVARLATLSPNGETIVWVENEKHELCEYSILAPHARCIDLLDVDPQMAQYLAWSPDSRWIAFTQDFFHTFRDGDLYTFDAQTLSHYHLTDDGTEDLPFDAGDDIPVDVLPAWGPDNQLYFWRSIRSARTESVYRMGANNTPELIQNVTLLVPGPDSVWKQPAVSPDGTTMAFLVLSGEMKEPRNGLYTVNLKTGSVDFIASLAELRAGTPAWVHEPQNQPTAVYWSGANLVVSMGLYQGESEPSNAVYIDVAAKTVTPLFDFSAFPTAEAFADAHANGAADGSVLLRTGVVSGDGKHYLFLHRLTEDTLGYSSLPLPPDGSAPTLLTTTDDNPGALSSIDSANVDGTRVLLEGKLFTVYP